MTNADRTIVWTPSPENIPTTEIGRFMIFVKDRSGKDFTDFADLYEWSIARPELFWPAVIEFTGLVVEGDTSPTWKGGSDHPMWGEWFPALRLNYAENLLAATGSGPAIVSWDETGHRVTYSHDELRSKTASIATFFASIGIEAGDRVGAFVPNIAEAVSCMLATTACGAVWSSCSPDFGTQAALDRFSQIAPRVLVVSDGYFHKGKRYSVLNKVTHLVSNLPSVERVVVIPFDDTPIDWKALDSRYRNYGEISSTSAPLNFVRLRFADPLFILYSSGTTGKPKCIVHSVGGTLLEHVKELSLHSNVSSGERIFYQTTCGWMMWNFLVSNLALRATIVLYDGNPLHENGGILWRLAQEASVSLFGTNAKYIATIEKEGISPKDRYSFPNLTRLLSTGSPLTPQSFDYIHRAIKPGIQISSISGGTDIIGCFALGSPISVVRRGELQVRSLGMDVQVFDDSGNSIVDSVGELVCRNPFPSMPVCFFNDSDRSRFRNAYFEKFPNVWHHGDFAELTSEGGMRILGRSDSTLNPGGIRIGTAELYQQVDSFSDVLESLAVGYEVDNDSKVVLFLKLRDDRALDEDLVSQINQRIRANLSPFHVPWKVVAAPDFPRTRNGKIMEACVRKIVRGESIESMLEGMSNPESTQFFSTWALSMKE